MTKRIAASSLMVVALACQDLAGFDSSSPEAANEPEAARAGGDPGVANSDAGGGDNESSERGTNGADSANGPHLGTRPDGSATPSGGASDEPSSDEPSSDEPPGDEPSSDDSGDAMDHADPDSAEAPSEGAGGSSNADPGDGGTTNTDAGSAGKPSTGGTTSAGGRPAAGGTASAGGKTSANAGTSASGAGKSGVGGASSGGTSSGSAPSRCESVVVEHPVTGAQHVKTCSPVEYATNPPCEGNHYDDAAAFGTYDEPIPKGFVVHSLEHGGIAIWYNCPKGCPAELARAEAWIEDLPEDVLCVPDGVPRRILLIPDPDLSTRWAASAWGWTLNAPCFDEAAFSKFYTAHYDKTHERYCRGSAVTANTCSGAR